MIDVKNAPNRLVRIGVCILVSVSFLHQTSCRSFSEQWEDIPNVIIINLSGVRNDESISASGRQYMPHLWNDMLKEGTLYDDVVCTDQQFHMPVFNVINTGRAFPLWYKVTSPTIFQYARKQYGWPAHKLWMIGHWLNAGVQYEADGYENTYPDDISMMLEVSKDLEQVLSRQELMLLDGMREESGKFFGFTFFIWDAFDELVYRLFGKVMQTFHPKLIHYLMNGPETGHYDSFVRYAHSVKRSDEMIYEIWDMIQADPFYKGKTYLFVFPNTGRDGYFKFHNSYAYDNPYHSWLYVFGPGVRKGGTVTRPVHLVDIFPTVARIMKVEVAAGDGALLSEVVPGGGAGD